MRRGALAIAGVLVMATTLAQAQTSTADGVDAFVRGDYQRAAEILKPIAESWPPRDHVAEFFMATLYESGRGVPADPIRACVLYVRAGSDPESVLGRTAMELMSAVQTSLTAEQFKECLLLAPIRFDHGFQPVTFTLEQGHWIALDLHGAAITYEGQEKRIDLGLAQGGAIFLPVEHTELTVGRDPAVRRHFVEFFTWIPGSTKDTWTLVWHLFEVVRNDLVHITTRELETRSAERPPTAPSFDVHELARVRVNDNGNAEWIIKSGSDEETGVIESEAERREQREQARARAATDARVDWTLVRDTQRTPALAYSDAKGCGNVFVFGWSGDRTEAISINADQELLGLSTAPRTFDLASHAPGLELLVHVYERPVRSWPFCTDVVMPMGPNETWRATRGTVTIELSPPGVDPRAPRTYRATIRVVSAEFVNAAGVPVHQVQPITLTAIVGGMY